MVRYVEPNHVLINYYSDIDEPLREKILKALKPHFAKISELKYGKNARVNSWAHINFLQIGQFIFVPQWLWSKSRQYINIITLFQ